jgi:hypothetical protein
VGLVARHLEEAGFSTVTLTTVPEFHRQVGMPRVAAIEYPFGRPVGDVHDRNGQRAVLLEALTTFAEAKEPGSVFHLPFTWPEDPKEADWHPPEASPLIKMFREEIKKARKEKGKG